MSGTPWGAAQSAADRLGITLEEYIQRVEGGEKWCVGCRAWQPVDDFGPDSTRSDGRQHTCRAGRVARSKRAKT